MGTLKGQNFRICTYDTTAAKYKVVGMATNCTVTLTQQGLAGSGRITQCCRRCCNAHRHQVDDTVHTDVGRDCNQ